MTLPTPLTPLDRKLEQLVACAIAKFMSLSRWTQKICVFCAQRYWSFLLPPCAKSREKMQTHGSRANGTSGAKTALARLGTDAHSLILNHIKMFTVHNSEWKACWKRCSSLMVNGNKNVKGSSYFFSDWDFGNVSQILTTSQGISSYLKPVEINQFNSTQGTSVTSVEAVSFTIIRYHQVFFTCLLHPFTPFTPTFKGI